MSAAASEATQHEKLKQQAEQETEKGYKVLEAGHKSLLQSDALYQYILEKNVYPREPAPLRELREMTANHPLNPVATPADEGQFLMMLVKLMNAKNTIELGVYTGYSLLSTALALPEDGKIIAIDIDRQNYELGVPFMKKAGVHHKIDFREGQCLPLLEELMQDEKNLGFFDFAFVDANKEDYLNYHEMLIKLVKVGGLIGYDNTLWQGSVAVPLCSEPVEHIWEVSKNNVFPDTSFTKLINYIKPFVLEFNKALVADTRIEISMVSIGDGITLCRRRE